MGVMTLCWLQKWSASSLSFDGGKRYDCLVC